MQEVNLRINTYKINCAFWTDLEIRLIDFPFMKAIIKDGAN